MTRWLRLTGLALATTSTLLFADNVIAQQGSSLGGTANSTGNPSATANSSPGFSLSSRFQSNFSQYTGGSQTAGQTTAGAAAATSGVYGQSANSTQNRGGMSSLGRMGGLGGIGGLGGFGFGGRNMMGGNNQMGSNNNKQIRTHLRLGFTAPKISGAVVSQRTTKILNGALSRFNTQPGAVTVKMESGTAVLQGTVDSDHAKGLAERLVLLEPGIEAVRNELTVGLAAPTPSTLPTPSR
jgi:hypothetical protein